VDDDDDFEDLYESLDTDNNGFISQSEFMAWWFKEDLEKSAER
jgi:Ca2+-binding EF-hand superfamily protein